MFSNRNSRFLDSIPRPSSDSNAPQNFRTGLILVGTVKLLLMHTMALLFVRARVLERANRSLRSQVRTLRNICPETQDLDLNQGYPGYAGPAEICTAEYISIEVSKNIEIIETGRFPRRSDLGQPKPSPD